MSRPLILLGLLLLAAPAYGQGVFPVNQWSQYGTGAWDQAIWRVGENGAAYPYDKLLQGDGSLVTMRPNGITLGAYRGQRGGQDAPWHAWWSGVWDSTRKRYLAIMGSGDQNESSNEVNEWDWALGIWNPNGRPVNPTTRLIVPNTVDWPSAYLYDPSKPGGPPAVIDLNNDYPNNVKIAQNGQKLYPLGRQTYGGIVYMPSVRRVWLWGGFGDWNPTGGPYLMVEYDPATQKYEVITTADGNEFGGGAFHGTVYPTATWDATNNRVLFLNSDGLWSYTPTAAYGSRTACLVGNCDGSPYQTRDGHTPTLLWDSKRQWLVAIGGDAVFDATKLVRWDFSGGLTNPSVTQVPITGTFALALGPEGPGALYDPVGDRYVVWAGGTTLYYINPDTAASTPFTPSAGSDPSAVTDTGGYGLGPGVWSRFWYIAGDDVYATLNFGTQQGVFVFKPSRAGSVPVLSSLSPASALQGGPAFTLTVTGANFVSGSVVQWNGSPRTTTFVSATQLTASIPASDLTAAGFASVKVFNPGPGGGASNALTFTITAVNPVPTLTSLAPSSALQGGPAFTLTVTGTNFIATSVVQWNGSPRTTTFVSATQLRASIPASDLTTAGSAPITVLNPAPGGGTSSALTFTITAVNPVPTLTSLVPSSALQGGPAFTLTVTGTNFIAASVVQWNGSPRTTTFVSATQLTASIPASDLTTAGSASVTVVNPAPGGGLSNALTFTITAVNPVPTLTSLAPSSALQGGPAFTLTVTGTNFIATSVVQWNGSPRTTTFVSATQLTASIPASDLTTAGSAPITVLNPAPGGGASNALTFTVTGVNPVPTLTSLVPSSALQGGPAFTLTVTGTNFIAASVVQWNGSPRTTTFVSATQLTASIPASDLTTAGSAPITVLNPAPGGGASNALTFTVTGVNPVPTLTSLAPSSAFQGGPAFTLTVTGTNFIATSVVQWNGSPRTTTFVSATQLRASIPASDLTTAGSAPITVLNPAPGGGASNALTFTITAVNPVPTLTSLAPSSAFQGGPAFTLTVTGTNFIATSVVQWNGRLRETTFVSATQLTASIPASDLTTAGSAPITVLNPAPGGGLSNALTFTITAVNPVPTLTSLAPSSALQGGPAFTLTVTGTNFIATSVVQWNGSPRTTTFVSATQLTASIPASDLTTAGSAPITVLNPAPGGGASNALTFTITPALTVTSVAPNQGAQGAVVPVTITGTGFAAGASVSVSGSGVTASNVAVASSTQITVTLTIAAKAPTNARKVTVTNSKGASAALMGGFTVTAP